MFYHANRIRIARPFKPIRQQFPHISQVTVRFNSAISDRLRLDVLCKFMFFYFTILSDFNDKQTKPVTWITLTSSNIPSWHLASHPSQLSLAIPPWVGTITNGGDDAHPREEMSCSATQ